MSEYDEMVRNIPKGLDRIILRILGFHKWRKIGGLWQYHVCARTVNKPLATNLAN